MFPDDDTCLEHLFRVRYDNRHQCGKCGKDAKYHRIKKRRAYECEWCGYQVYPTAGTPFESTRTPLTDWFEVMHMFCTTRNGVAAKEVQRRIGCTYKTAWRMCHEIRMYMGYVDGDAPLGGPGGGAVEIDKSFIGGHDKKWEDDKAVVLGMIERKGEVIARVIPSKNGQYVQPEILKYVKPGTRLMADEAPVYGPLTSKGYRLDGPSSVQGICARRCACEQSRSLLGQCEAHDQRDPRLGFEEASPEVPAQSAATSLPDVRASAFRFSEGRSPCAIE